MANKQTTREESQSSQDNLNFGSGKPLSPLPCRSPGNDEMTVLPIYMGAFRTQELANSELLDRVRASGEIN